MVRHRFRKPAGESPYRFKSCTLRKQRHRCEVLRILACDLYPIKQTQTYLKFGVSYTNS